ncbi:MAG: BON domain-containing protein [Gemmataceae bacterium]
MKENPRRRWAALVLALGVLAQPAWAGSEPPRPPESALGKIRDLAATVKARRVLQENPALAELNLGVSVENGVAQVWGPVPTPEAARDAVLRLEGIAGVRLVRTNFYLEDRRERRLLDLVQAEPAPERIEAAKPEIETGKLPIRPREPVVPVARVGSEAVGAPRVFAPRAVASTRPEASGERRSPEASLSAKIQQMQREEPRFRAIVVEVQGQSLHVQRGASSGADLMDLVGRLRRLPGVRDVILNDD